MGKYKDEHGKTRFGQWLQKAGEKLPSLAKALPQLASGNIGGAVATVTEVLTGEQKGENSDVANQLMMEWKKEQNNFAKEMFELEVRDRESAREREIEMAKTGKTDWMMYAVGICGLLSFMVCVYAVIWIPTVRDNELFIHLIGMIEGVVISQIFSYYFGTSKSSHDKNELINKSQ